MSFTHAMITLEFTRATEILPSHRFEASIGGPLIQVQGTIEKLFPSPGNHHGANHQHMIVDVTRIVSAQGIAAEQIGKRIFVAIRFGDSEGLSDPIPLVQGQPIELKGEYVDQASAYPTQDNDHPILPVMHFTHHPVGFVLFGGITYS